MQIIHSTVALDFFAILATVASPPPSGIVGTVWDLALKGGILMIPIAACSLLALAFAIERAISLRKSVVIPPGFVDGARAALREGPARAIDYCTRTPSPISRIFEAALRRWDRPVEQVERQIVEAGVRESIGLRARLRALSVIAAVAPLLGLLGTIFGMIKAFRTVATNADALGRTELLASGIYEAMVTTAAGLIVAIPVILVYHALGAKADRLVLAMDDACMELADERAGTAAPRPSAISTPDAHEHSASRDASARIGLADPDESAGGDRSGDQLATALGAAS